ncbi:MAG: hypothetical protein VXZ82_14860 [Planctomycetota bacterium]|nr:hypothetical protein [Planctomycetota bacterium]
MKKLDAFVIDELVAGNLHGEQYRRVLKALDEQPDGWKECAMAFLQEQALKRELRVLVADDEIWNPNRKSRAIVETPASVHPVSPIKSSEHVRLEWMTRLSSIAALLLLSFSVGWFGAGWGRGTSESDGKPSEATVAGGQANEIPAAADGSIPPMYVGKEMIPVDRSPPALLQELESRGSINLESFDGYVPVRVGDSIELIPVQQYRVRSGSVPY